MAKYVSCFILVSAGIVVIALCIAMRAQFDELLADPNQNLKEYPLSADI